MFSVDLVPVERRSTRPPRPTKPGALPPLREGPVDATPGEPCRTEVRSTLMHINAGSPRYLI